MKEENDMGHCADKSPLQPGDLPDLDRIPARSKFIGKAADNKMRKDKIKRFYYYETTSHGSKAYLHVAETDVVRNGHLWHDRFLYSVTGSLKIKSVPDRISEPLCSGARSLNKILSGTRRKVNDKSRKTKIKNGESR